MSGVRVEGDYAILRIHRSELHALRVALRPIRQGETTSTATQELRDRLDKALAIAESKLPRV